jgi:hypothetical protein
LVSLITTFPPIYVFRMLFVQPFANAPAEPDSD